MDCSVSVAQAYHREIGREATALMKKPVYYFVSLPQGNRYGIHGLSNITSIRTVEAYHREIGREATAGALRMAHVRKAYHREIGRC